MHGENDVTRVLQDDGVGRVELTQWENRATTSVAELEDALGTGSWAVRLAYNNRFGGVLIRQMPGEGNRKHFHPDADECWIIVSGHWEWYIEGLGLQKVGPHDIVIVRQGQKHQITCLGPEPGMRFAITKPDVSHVYGD
ncbi:MAG: cupin domain-containing protein [Spirochaetales bacterium]|nr:cupin domain-containing protein [Spirochaetales bacterium]